MTDNKEVNVQENKDVQEWEQILEKERSFAPFSDIYETENDFVLVANMPGIKKENITLKLEEGSLVIFGKVNYDELMKRKYILNETEIGNYYRRFKISDSIDISKIQAKFDNGQLILTLPKHDRIKPRKINIS
jgi:HSP20 family protein